MIYDIIGDIHGQAHKLHGLLRQLGYDHNGSHYVPPDNHRTIFIGDFIDRGAQQLDTLNTVFAMLDAGVADAVMGNHEYNALAYAMPRTDGDGYLRPHTDKNHHQHRAFLHEAPFASATHRHWITRFYTLPLWLETEHACFVHACWDAQQMAVLTPILDAAHCLTPSALHATADPDQPAYHALERILKGMEISLPEPHYITDKDGIKRHNTRVRWWLDDLPSHPIVELACDSGRTTQHIPPNLRSNDPALHFHLATNKPIFIGHYWLTGTPAPLSRQVVCTDYSAATDNGPLTCYQYDSAHPQPLSAKKFVQYRHTSMH